MRRKFLAALIALSLAIIMPFQSAYADAPDSASEYYERLNQVFETSLNVNNFRNRATWLDAYVEVLQLMSSPTQLRTVAYRLETAYGYDIVNGEGTGIYTVDSGAGGAFQLSTLSVANQSENISILSDWTAKAIFDGPEWPIPSGESNAPTDSENYYTYTLNANLNETVFAGNDWRNYYSFGGTSYTLNMVPNSSNYTRGAETLTLHVKKVVIDSVPSGYEPILVANPSMGNIDLSIVCVSSDAYELTYALEGNANLTAPGSITKYVNTDGRNIYNKTALTCTKNAVNEATFGENLTSFSYNNIGNSTYSMNPAGGFGGTSGNWLWIYEEYEIPEPEPDVPVYPRPTTPTTPTQPDQSGVAAPTVDVKPITDRLDILNGHIFEFELMFTQYYTDSQTFWGSLYDQLTYWLDKIERNTRNTAGWARNISYQLNLIQTEIDRIGDTYRPTISVGNTMQQQLTEDLDVLKGKFPFSLPWDLMALLLMLEAPRHSMVFVVPMAYFGQTANITIDLSQYEQVGIVSRAISRWLFGFYLVTRTKDLLLKGE